MIENLVIGGRYNFKNQPERLIYIGMSEPRNGSWRQFALVQKPDAVWCEVLDKDLHLLEVTKGNIIMDSREQFEKMCKETFLKCMTKEEYSIAFKVNKKWDDTYEYVNHSIRDRFDSWQARDAEIESLKQQLAERDALIAELSKDVDLLRGHLQNCVNHLEGMQRRFPNRGLQEPITRANNVLYKTLHSDKAIK
jgi:hypothetical protein